MIFADIYFHEICSYQRLVQISFNNFAWIYFCECQIYIIEVKRTTFYKAIVEVSNSRHVNNDTGEKLMHHQDV